MAYQSEAQLEKQFIEQLQGQDYHVINIPNYNSLFANFRVQCEKYNNWRESFLMIDKK